MGIGDFINKVTGRAGAQTPGDAEDDAQLAAAALLVQLALADGVYADAEQAQIKKVIGGVFNLEGEELDALTTKAERAAHDALDHYQFTRKAKNLAPEVRQALVEGLWDVAFADGEESRFEDATIRRIADLLYVDQRLSRLARKQAKSPSDPSST